MLLRVRVRGRRLLLFFARAASCGDELAKVLVAGAGGDEEGKAEVAEDFRFLISDCRLTKFFEDRRSSIWNLQSGICDMAEQVTSAPMWAFIFAFWAAR